LAAPYVVKGSSSKFGATPDTSLWHPSMPRHPGWEPLVYSVFHRFRQAKFASWWFDFKLEPIFATTPLTSKNNACYKSGQIWFKNNHFAIRSKSVKRTELAAFVPVDLLWGKAKRVKHKNWAWHIDVYSGKVGYNSIDEICWTAFLCTNRFTLT
jgi:hypothetical protein